MQRPWRARRRCKRTLTVAENALGVALAFQLHLMEFDPSLSVKGDPRLLRIFDERLSPLDGNQSFQRTDQRAHCESIFHVVVALTIGLEAWDSSVATHVIILVERLIRCWPGILTQYTLRPILVGAFIVCLKLHFDEELNGLVDGLEVAGFPSIDRERLALLEGAFLHALDWKATVNRMTYFWYTLELRTLFRKAEALFAASPRLAELVVWMDGMREPGIPGSKLEASHYHSIWRPLTTIRGVSLPHEASHFHTRPLTTIPTGGLSLPYETSHVSLPEIDSTRVKANQ